MSSAILYLAIIAIWAGVLIPRWLRRDSAHGHSGQEVSNLTAAQTVATDVVATVPGATVPDDAHADEADDTGAPEADDAGLGAQVPASPVQARRRVLAARRRLLWMMLALEAAADVLAASGLAAWWVIAPPTVMLAGYLFLLREAAQADAERDARERDAVQAREEARHAREAGRTRPAEHAPAAPMTPAVFAAAPVPADYEDLGHGRDYTPGGRHAAWDDAPTEDDAYDQYTEERLRAVGD
jgi:hypothetical protein